MNTGEKQNIFVRSICLALSAVFFITNVVGAKAPETKNSSDFWTERQKAVARHSSLVARGSNDGQRETGDKRLLLAQLPGQLATPQGLASGSLKQNILPDITGIEAKASHQSAAGIPDSLVRNGPVWLRTLPYNYGPLEEFYESPKKDSPVVIFVQDVHGHYEAQQNIANIIQSIVVIASKAKQSQAATGREIATADLSQPRNDDRGVLIGLEGAVGAFDFSPYRAFPNKEINKEIADYFLKSGLISGPEYAGLVGPENITFWGVEDKDSYLANIETFKEALPLQKQVKVEIEVKKQEINVKKGKIFKPDLLELDKKRDSYQQGTLGLGEYLEYLSRPNVVARLLKHESASPPVIGRRLKHDTATAPDKSGNYNYAIKNSQSTFFPNIRLFLETFKLEKMINFQKVEDERRILIEKLVNVLEKEELENLVYQAVAHRMGNIDNSAYYHELENICQKHGLKLSNWPELARYVRYSIGADKIDRRTLFKEINKLEENVVAQFTRGELAESIGRRSEHDMTTAPDKSGNYTTAAMDVYETSKKLSLISKLIDNNLTDEEWEQYKKLGVRNSELGIQNLEVFEKFYEVATSRNRILVENLLSKINSEVVAQFIERRSEHDTTTAPDESGNYNDAMKSTNAVAVLVAGGFHTQAMAKLLKDKQISYAILSPKLTEIDPTKGAQYLEAFAQDRTPLDKLMLGEKIFLSAFRSMGQVPGGIAHEFESNVAMRSNFYSALEAGLNLDELLSQTKASQSEANKIINGLQKLIENKLPFIKTIRFLNYAKTRDDGAVLPMLINDGEGFAVEIHPKGWVSRKVTVTGTVDGELTRHSFRIRSLKLGERLSFQVPPLLPKTMKTASAWSLLFITPKEVLEKTATISGSTNFNVWLTIAPAILFLSGTTLPFFPSLNEISGILGWLGVSLALAGTGLLANIVIHFVYNALVVSGILKRWPVASIPNETTSKDVWVYVFARPATRGVRPLSTEEALPDSNIMDAPEKRNRKLESNEPGGFFKPVTIFALLGLMTAGGLIGTIFYSQASFVNELFTGLDIVSPHWQGMLAYLGLGIAFPFVGAMARRRTGEKPNMRKKKEELRDKSLREGERIFLLDFAERYSQHLPKANYEIFFKSEPYDVELEENPVAAMVNMRLTSQHHTKRIQEALLKEVRRLAGLPRPSNAKLTPENIITDFLVLKYWFGINNKQFAGIYGVAPQRISLVEPRTFRMLWPVLKEVFRSVNEHGHMPAPLIEYVGLLSEKGLGALESLMRVDTVFRDRVLDDLLEDGQLIENLPERQRQAAQRLLATMQQLNSGTNMTPLEWATHDGWETQFLGYASLELQASNIDDEANIAGAIKSELISRASDPADTTYYGSIKAYKWPIGQDEITYYMLVDPTFRNPKSETEKFRNRLEKVLANVPESVQREFLSQFKEDVNPLVRAHLSSARYAAVDPLPNGFVGIRQEVFTDNGAMLRSWLNEIAASLPEVVRRRINLLEVEQLREIFLEIADTHELRHELLISERAVLADLNFLTEPNASYKEVVDKLEEKKVIMTAFGMRTVEYIQQRQDAEELRNILAGIPAGPEELRQADIEIRKYINEGTIPFPFNRSENLTFGNLFKILRNTYIGAIDAQEANRRLWSLKAMSSRKPYRLSQEWINAAIYLLTQETPTPEQLTNLRKDLETPAVDISRDESLDIEVIMQQEQTQARKFLITLSKSVILPELSPQLRKLLEDKLKPAYMRLGFEPGFTETIVRLAAPALERFLTVKVDNVYANDKFSKTLVRLQKLEPRTKENVSSLISSLALFPDLFFRAVDELLDDPDSLVRDEATEAVFYLINAQTFILLQAKKPSVIEPQEPNPTALKVLFWGYMETAWRLFQNPPEGFEQRKLYDRTFGWMMVSFHALERLSERPEFSDIQLVEEQKAIEIINDIQYSILPIGGRTHQLRPERFSIAFRHGPANVKRLIEYLTSRSSYDLLADQLPAALSTILTYLEEGFEIETPATQSFIRDFLAHLEEKVNKLEPPLPQKILERLSALRKRLQSPEQGKPASILGRKFWKQAPVLEQAFGLPLLIMAARPILKKTAQFLVKLGLADESLLEAAKNLKKTDKGSLGIGVAGSLALISWLAAAMVFGVWWLWPLGVGIWMASAGYVFQRAHDRYAKLVRGTRVWNTFYVNKGDRMITQFFNRDKGYPSLEDKFKLFLVGGILAGVTVAPALLFLSGTTLPFLSPVSQLSILQVSFITPALLFAGLLANIVLHFIYNALVVSGILKRWPLASIPRKMLIWQLSSGNNKVRQTAITKIYEIYYPTIERHAVRAYHMFRYISEEIAGVPFTNLSPEDFISEAKISMYGSIEKFNVARYSPYLVESYIFRYVDRDLARMMSRVWDVGIYQAGEIVRILNKSVRFPSEQYREYLKLTKEQVVQQMSALDAHHQLESIIKQIQAQYQPSLESRHGLVREENLMAVKDTRLKPEEIIYADERYRIIMTAIDGLDKPKQKKAKRALKLRFGLEDGTEWNNQEIADKFSLSRESIRLYIDTALKRLRLPSRELMELIYNPVQDIREEVSVFQSLATNPLPVSSSFEPNKGQLRAASRSADYLTETEKDELWRWVNMELPLFQKQILPYVLQGMSNKKMVGLMRVKVDNVSKAKELLLRDLRIWFTLGIFDQYGTYEHIRKFLIKLAREPGRLNSNNGKDKTTGKTRAASKNKRLIFNVVLWLILPAFAVIAQWLGFHMSSVGQIQQSGFMVWSGWQEITDMETLLSALAAAGLSSFIWYVAWGIPLAFAAITSPPDKPENPGNIEEWLEWLSAGTREQTLQAISEIQVLLSTSLLFQQAASEIAAKSQELVRRLSNRLLSESFKVREAAINLLAYMAENEIIIETIAEETSTIVHNSLKTEPARKLLESILPDVEVREALEKYKLTDPKKLADVVMNAYFKVTGKSERREKARRIALMSLLEFVSLSTAQRLKSADMKDVYINKTLENVLGASGKFQAAGATLNKALYDLSLQFPHINLKDEITEGGRIAVLIKRGENIIDVVIPKGLETPLQTGDKIYLIAKVGGGAAEQGEKKTGINGQDLQLAMRLATMGLGHSEITELKTQLRKEAEQAIKNLEIQDKKIEQNILEKYIPDIYLILLVQRAINRVDIVNPGHVAHEALVAQPDKMLVSLFEKFVQTLKTEPRKARPALLRLEAVTELHFKALKKWLIEDVSLEDARINAKRFVEKEVKQLLKSVNAENWEYVEVPWSLNVEFKKGLPVSRVTFVLSEGYSLSSFTPQFRSRLKNYPSASIEERANTLKALGSQIEQGKIEPEHNLLVTFRIPTEDDRELFVSMLGESETHTKLAAKWIVTEEEWRQLEKTANQYESLKKQIANEISLLENQLRATELSEELFRINTRLHELNNDSEFSAHWQMELEAMSGRLTAIHAVVSNFGDNALRKLFLQTNKLVTGLQHKYQEHFYREALARAEHAFTSHVEWLWNHASIVELRSLGEKPNFKAMLSELKFIDKHDALLQSLSNLRTILLKNKQYDFRLEHFYERLKYLHNMVIEINSYFLEFKNIDRPRADQFYYAAVIGIAREFIAMTLVWAISMGTYENIFSAKYARNRILKSFQYNPVASVSSVPVIGESADEPLKRLSELIINEQMLTASKPESKDSLLSHVFFDLYTALLADLAVIREELAGVLAKHVSQHRLVVLLIKILYHLRVVLDLAVKADKLNRTMYEQISIPARALASMLGLNENDIDELYSFDILHISALLNQPDIVFKKISPKIKSLVEAESVLDENDVAPGTQVTLSLVLERRGLLDIASEKGTIIKVNGQIVADSANTMVSAGDTITMILIMPAGGAAGRVSLMALFLLFGLLSIAALIDTGMLTFALNILPAWDMQTFPVTGFSLLVLAAVTGAFLAKLPGHVGSLLNGRKSALPQLLNTKPTSILGKKFWKQAPVLEPGFGYPLLIMAARPILKVMARLLVKVGLADKNLLDAADNLKKTDKGSLRIGAAGSLALIAWLAAAMVYGVWWLWPMGVGIWMASAGYVFQRAHGRYAELVRGTRGWNTFYVNKGDRMITQFFNRDKGGLSRGDKFRLFLVGSALAGVTVAPALLFLSGASLPFLPSLGEVSGILGWTGVSLALASAGLLANIVLHFGYNALVVSGILKHSPVASITGNIPDDKGEPEKQFAIPESVQEQILIGAPEPPIAPPPAAALPEQEDPFTTARTEVETIYRHIKEEYEEAIGEELAPRMPGSLAIIMNGLAIAIVSGKRTLEQAGSFINYLIDEQLVLLDYKRVARPDQSDIIDETHRIFQKYREWLGIEYKPVETIFVDKNIWNSLEPNSIGSFLLFINKIVIPENAQQFALKLSQMHETIHAYSYGGLPTMLDEGITEYLTVLLLMLEEGYEDLSFYTIAEYYPNLMERVNRFTSGLVPMYYEELLIVAALVELSGFDPVKEAFFTSETRTFEASLGRDIWQKVLAHAKAYENIPKDETEIEQRPEINASLADAMQEINVIGYKPIPILDLAELKRHGRVVNINGEWVIRIPGGSPSNTEGKGLNIDELRTLGYTDDAVNIFQSIRSLLSQMQNLADFERLVPQLEQLTVQFNQAIPEDMVIQYVYKMGQEPSVIQFNAWEGALHDVAMFHERYELMVTALGHNRHIGLSSLPDDKVWFEAHQEAAKAEAMYTALRAHDVGLNLDPRVFEFVRYPYALDIFEPAIPSYYPNLSETILAIDFVINQGLLPAIYDPVQQEFIQKDPLIYKYEVMSIYLFNKLYNEFRNSALATKIGENTYKKLISGIVEAFFTIIQLKRNGYERFINLPPEVIEDVIKNLIIQADQQAAIGTVDDTTERLISYASIERGFYSVEELVMKQLTIAANDFETKYIEKQSPTTQGRTPKSNLVDASNNTGLWTQVKKAWLKQLWWLPTFAAVAMVSNLASIDPRWFIGVLALLRTFPYNMRFVINVLAGRSQLPITSAQPFWSANKLTKWLRYSLPILSLMTIGLLLLTFPQTHDMFQQSLQNKVSLFSLAWFSFDIMDTLLAPKLRLALGIADRTRNADPNEEQPKVDPRSWESWEDVDGFTFQEVMWVMASSLVVGDLTAILVMYLGIPYPWNIALILGSVLATLPLYYLLKHLFKAYRSYPRHTYEVASPETLTQMLADKVKDYQDFFDQQFKPFVVRFKTHADVLSAFEEESLEEMVDRFAPLLDEWDPLAERIHQFQDETNLLMARIREIKPDADGQIITLIMQTDTLNNQMIPTEIHLNSLHRFIKVVSNLVELTKTTSYTLERANALMSELVDLSGIELYLQLDKYEIRLFELYVESARVLSFYYALISEIAQIRSVSREMPLLSNTFEHIMAIEPIILEQQKNVDTTLINIQRMLAEVRRWRSGKGPKPENLGAAAARPDDEDPLTLPLLGQLISEDAEEAEEAWDKTMRLAARLITEGLDKSEREIMDIALRQELEQIVNGLGTEGVELKFEDIKDEDLLALYRGLLAKHAMTKIVIIDDKHPDYIETVSNPREQLNKYFHEFKTNPTTAMHPLFRLTAVTEEQYDALLGVWLTPEHEVIAQARQKANEMLFEKIKIFLTPKYVEKTEDWQDKEDSFQFKVFFKAPLEGWPLLYVTLGSAPGKLKRDFNENFITNLKKTGKPDAGTLQTLNSHFANSKIIPVHIHTTFQLRNAKELSEFSDIVKDILGSNQAEIARWVVTEDDWSQLVQAGKEYESIRKKITDELMALKRQERIDTIKEKLAGINAQLNVWSRTHPPAPDAPKLETISENLTRLSDEVNKLGDSTLSKLYSGIRQIVFQLLKPKQQPENIKRLEEEALYRVSQAIKTDMEWFIAGNVIKNLRDFSQDVHFKTAQPELNQKLESFLAVLNKLNDFIQTVQPTGFSHKDFVSYLEAIGRLFNEAGGFLVMMQSQHALGGFSSQLEMYFQLAKSALVTDLIITTLLDWTISVGKYEKLLKKADLKKIRLGRPYKAELLVPSSIPDVASSLSSLLVALVELQSMTQAIAFSELPERLLLQALTLQGPTTPSLYDELLTYLPIVRDELEKTGHSAASTPIAVIHLLKIPYLLRNILDYEIIRNTLNIKEFTKLVEPGYTVAENLGLLPEVKQLLSYRKRSKEFNDVSPLSVNLVKQLWGRGGPRLSLVSYLLLPVLSATASFGVLAIAYMALPAISGLLSGFVPEFLVLQLNIPINSGGFAVVGNSSNLLWYISGLAWIGWSAAFMIGAARAGGSVLKKITELLETVSAEAENEDSMEEATLQIMPLKARGLAELLFPSGKITEAFYNRRNAKKALFNFTLHAAEAGLVYIQISNIVIPPKKRQSGNIVPFMKSPVTWLRAAHLLSRDELPTQEELEKTATQIEKQITTIETELKGLRETVKSPADNLEPLGLHHGFKLALAKSQRENLSVTLKEQAGELETVFNSGSPVNRVSENMLSAKAQEYEKGFRLGWRVGQAAQQGKAGATNDLIKKADSKIADTSLYVLDVTDGELQEHAMRGFNDFIKNRDGTELLLVSRISGLSAEEVRQRAYETLEGRVAVDNHMLASLIAQSTIRDNGSLQSVMEQVYIDGELRNRINTESFIKTLTGSGQKAGVRIFTSDFYGWTPVNNEMAKLVRILLLVTNNIMVDMTTGIDRAYEIKKVVNKQA